MTIHPTISCGLQFASLFLLWGPVTSIAQIPGLARQGLDRGQPTQLQDRVKELWNLSIIKADILRRLGQKDRNLAFNMVTRTSTEQVTPVPRANVPIMSVASILSEPPDKPIDDATIQFHLSGLSVTNNTVVDKVNLLIRIKSRKKKKTRNVQKRNRRSDDLQDALTTVKGRRKKDKQRKTRFQDIELTVSETTASGLKGDKITSIQSRIRKTKTLMIALPSSLVYNALKSNVNRIQIHVQCTGCNNRTSMLLLKRSRKKQRASIAKSRLPKRRPMLFIQTYNKNG